MNSTDKVSGSAARNGCVSDLLRHFDAKVEGARACKLIEKLYPICRSITGNGVRESLRWIQESIPLTIHEVPTGTPVFDWTVPNEWNIREAWIKDSKGKRIVDLADSSLHVVSYSVPVHCRMRLDELKKHLFSLPDAPEWVPYRTSYYRETWGFCLADRLLSALPEDGDYEVYIDSTLEPGNLSYGEYRLPGSTDEEVIISCHACHPALCNDNLSGMSVAALLASLLQDRGLRYSYRFLWIPGTIGSITWLALNEAILERIKHGLVVSCVGDAGAFTYKRSRRGDAEVDRVVEHVLQRSGSPHTILDFSPYGYDERQYCSPGINLPVGCFMRTPNARYPEYHTSADNLAFVSQAALGESLLMLLRVVETLERNHCYLNLNPKCEPQLGRRGLYRQIGGTNSSGSEEAMLWVLNYSDGRHSLLDIAERSQLEWEKLVDVTEVLLEHGLLRRVA